MVHVAILLALQGIEILVQKSNPDSDVILMRAFYLLATYVPSIAVAVRRLHDTNRSGWWYLFMFVPIIGIIMLMIDFAEDSHPGDNRYGPNPKGDLLKSEPLVISEPTR